MQTQQMTADSIEAKQLLKVLIALKKGDFSVRLPVEWTGTSGKIADTLNEFGYDVKTAYNGAEALEVMRRWLPHAIVLDLMMPRLDGSGLCEMLRHNPRFASVPVLLVTAAYGAREAAERIGAAAYLTKPFELDTLLEVIDQLVEQRVPLTAIADD